MTTEQFNELKSLLNKLIADTDDCSKIYDIQQDLNDHITRFKTFETEVLTKLNQLIENQ